MLPMTCCYAPDGELSHIVGDTVLHMDDVNYFVKIEHLLILIIVSGGQELKKKGIM